ncbi:HDOD domain-containing protein [Hydrogenophaga sp. 5NK40-0174]|uniref:HDOD domain-containing protein n=1 Tax=Hydrogenophaga sp. 5NK40-0174 TaxID=3127649 RepID=UPI003108480A
MVGFLLLFGWVLLMFGIAWLWWRYRRPQMQERELPPELLASMAQAAKTQTGKGSAAPEKWTPPPPRALPDALASFKWHKEGDLPRPHVEKLLSAVKGIPRPPRAMQKLISPGFLQTASSSDLAELLMKEPVIAAKVLATVNSPAYGLRQPIAGLGQAITFLGMNTVRSICLQSMLNEAFKAGLAESQATFDAIWRATAVASDLASRLGKALKVPDLGELSTQVIFSFVGELAFASLLPAEQRERWLRTKSLPRLKMEQDVMGFTTAEFGGLLLKEWEVPAELSAKVVHTGRIVVTPADKASPAMAPRMAVAYLSQVLARRLALGHLSSLREYDIGQDDSPEMHHLRDYLHHPQLQGLSELLASEDIHSAAERLASNPGSASI